MSLATINSCIVIPDRPNWDRDVQWAKVRPGATLKSIQGQEDRVMHRSTPLVSLTYMVTPYTLQERSLLVARVEAAVKSGRACVPYWGRGQQLASACSTTALTLTADSEWTFAAGDFVFLLEPTTGEWEVIEVASVSGVNVTLDASPSTTYPAGSLCWPVLFGVLSVGSLGLDESYRGSMELTIAEPVGSGSLIDSSSTCPAVPADFTLPTVDFCEGTPTLSMVPGEVCGGDYELSWTGVDFVDGWLLKVSDDPGGPYTTVDSFTAEEVSTTVARAYLADKYYVVVGVVGDYTTDPSNEEVVPGRTIEKAMRAIQERIESVNESAVTWPARTLPSASATADYPADDWYAEDIASGGASTEVTLIQAIFDAITDTVLSHYTPGVEGLAHDATIPFYQRGQSGTPFATLPLTVTTVNRQASLALIESICCALQYINQDANYALIEDRNGLGGDGTSPSDGANGTAAEALYAARVDYDSNSFVDLTASPSFTTPGVHGSILSSDPVSPGGPRTWSSYLVTSRFKLGGDWTGYGSLGRLYLLLAVSPGTGPEDNPYLIEQGNNPPVPTTGHLWKVLTYSMPQTTITTGYFGDQVPANPEPDQTLGWFLRRAMWLLEKSPFADDNEWTYFP